MTAFLASRITYTQATSFELDPDGLLANRRQKAPPVASVPRPGAPVFAFPGRAQEDALRGNAEILIRPAF